MRSTLALTLVAASLTLIACQKKSENSSPTTTSTSSVEELRSMGAHAPSDCPALSGIYVPVKGKGSYFFFEKIDGNLVMKSRRPESNEFQGAIPINGKPFYLDDEVATARCNGGKILVELSHPTKPKKTVLLQGGTQDMTRYIFQDGHEVQTTEYIRMIQ